MKGRRNGAEVWLDEPPGPTLGIERRGADFLGQENHRHSSSSNTPPAFAFSPLSHLRHPITFHSFRCFEFGLQLLFCLHVFMLSQKDIASINQRSQKAKFNTRGGMGRMKYSPKYLHNKF